MIENRPVLDIRRRFAVFTMTSALPFDCGKATEDTQCLTPHLCLACHEFRTAIARKLFRSAKGAKERTEVGNQASRAPHISAHRGEKDLCPASKAIPDNKIAAAPIVKKVSKHSLKWGGRRRGQHRGCGSL